MEQTGTASHGTNHVHYNLDTDDCRFILLAQAWSDKTGKDMLAIIRKIHRRNAFVKYLLLLSGLAYLVFTAINLDKHGTIFRPIPDEYVFVWSIVAFGVVNLNASEKAMNERTEVCRMIDEIDEFLALFSSFTLPHVHPSQVHAWHSLENLKRAACHVISNTWTMTELGGTQRERQAVILRVARQENCYNRFFSAPPRPR